MQTVGNVTTIGHGARTEIKLVLGDAEVPSLNQSDQKHRKYRKWLAPWLFDKTDDSQSRLLNSLHRNAADGTGEWFVKDFLPDWLKTGTDHLCIHGPDKQLIFLKLGGADSFVDEIKSNILPVPVFFAFDRRYTHTPEFLLRTILAQFCLLQTIPSGIENEYKRQVDASAIRHVLELACSVIKGLDDDAIRLDGCDATDRTRPLSLNLIVDALDEVPDRKQRAIVEVLDHLSALNSKLKHVRIRIIMFVRTDASVHAQYSGDCLWSMGHITKEIVSVDIDTAVRVRLGSHPSLQNMSAAGLDEVVKSIVTRVDGMFRLAALYCDEIDKLQRQTTTAEEVLELVACLPGQLYDFYDRILERVSDKTLRRYIVRALGYILVGELVDETYLAAISAVAYKSWYSWFGNIMEKPIESQDILTPLNGLIATRRTSSWAGIPRLVTLAHFSVAEYLRLATTRKALKEYDFDSRIFVDGNRALAWSYYVFRIYGSLYPEYLETDNLRTVWAGSHHRIHFYLRRHLKFTASSGKTVQYQRVVWLLRAHRLLFDMVMNIACVYSSHLKRCRDVEPWAPIAFDWDELIDRNQAEPNFCLWWLWKTLITPFPVEQLDNILLASYFPLMILTKRIHSEGILFLCYSVYFYYYYFVLMKWIIFKCGCSLERWMFAFLPDYAQVFSTDCPSIQ
ncbi:hypothetical protein BS50DRAFT_591188 [Corynespora cassiicola Philippines]|uniref:Uncharacterized protein n=1 Tax=Corynespora cassiicola Philippines TaxID=1448308 RepID=A0A2T2NBX9_CORCC|nr:hypothetical protein BS50DRAFT_591188 [Corynespora cassiicola Philippines]